MTNTPDQPPAPKRAPGTQRKAVLLRPVPNRAGIGTRFQQREVFALVLRAEPNRRGKPYSERTIGAYLDAVDSLARWLTGVGHPDGFDTITVGQLNLYLSHYLDRPQAAPLSATGGTPRRAAPGPHRGAAQGHLRQRLCGIAVLLANRVVITSWLRWGSAS